MNIDGWIVAFSALTVIATLWMGFRSARASRTASDFFVAGRSVSVGWNASAISGEYLSAASFMGVAGMVMSSGYDALWYPVCYACGYLFLLLFIAGPLRRFGAYTIPDFAEGRFDSPLFRKIAVVFVLFIGFFYTMPQMKGAGTTLAYIFPGLPYWAGVVLVGAVITLNVALGGMKGITLVQAFQYWLKMFAISAPVFVLMAVYGGYGNHVGANQAAPQVSAPSERASRLVETVRRDAPVPHTSGISSEGQSSAKGGYRLFNLGGEPMVPFTLKQGWRHALDILLGRDGYGFGVQVPSVDTTAALNILARISGREMIAVETLPEFQVSLTNAWRRRDMIRSLESQLVTNGLEFVALNANRHLVLPSDARADYEPAIGLLATASMRRSALPTNAPSDSAWLNPFGPLTTKAAKAAGLSAEQARPYSLLYTYSLIIALVCGTAGLPHILVRFYTNPDGVAAKRTTMWVMILIGVFYLFPPMFGVLGRNLMPELYTGLSGIKGTDQVVLRLPILLREKYGVLGSILSGITCAGAFAAFMSTFSGLLVSMTGALAHDVYGRMLRPKSTPQERMRMFKLAAILIGGVAMLLGSLVEPLEINFMVGQAFAIAAASYFPLLFMSVWWRGMTMRGAAVGMLTGGLCALAAATLTNVSNLALDKGPMGKIFAGFAPMNQFWAQHPLLRILCEQPAIWSVPLALGLMFVVSKLTARQIPGDIRMKMLVLHAPESLGLKKEYIQEHQHGH